MLLLCFTTGAPQTQAISSQPPEVTKESIASTEKGFAWLMKAMNRDGGFGVDIGAQSELGLTSIVGLAMLSEGSTPLEGTHAKALRKIRKYVVNEINSGRMRSLAKRNNTQLQRKIGHEAHSFFAALFLSQIIGSDNDMQDAAVRKALQRAVQEVTAAQQVLLECLLLLVRLGQRLMGTNVGHGHGLGKPARLASCRLWRQGIG